MAINLRIYPIITGKDAQRFIEREQRNTANLQKKLAAVTTRTKNDADKI